MKKPLATIAFQSAKLISAVVLTAALAAGCSKAPAKPAQGAAQEQQIPAVRVQPIAKTMIADPLEQVADVVSAIQLDVVAKTGGDVLEIVKKKGELVNKGDVIFRIDPTDIELQHEQAELNQRNSQLQYSISKDNIENSKTDARNGVAKLEQAVKDLEKTYNKLRNDYDAGLVAKPQVDQAETQLNNTKLDLQSARDKLNALETNKSLEQLQVAADLAGVSLKQADRALGNLEVKAPASGVVTDLGIEVGMSVPSGFRAGTVQQLDPIKIKAELTEETAKLVRGKQELTFYIPGVVDKTKAKVSYLADVMNATTKSYTLELEVPNPDRKIRPGTKAQVLLTEAQDQNVVAIPTLSVVREGSDTYVFVVNGDHVEKRKVELGRLKDANQEVLSGVKEGEQLVVTGQHLLKDKDKVQLAK
ncbi:RND transporter [Gordoniibacillus kamchatkensis]|uniref:RND transporter n=2 Tax=Gordoniibacillus kamchatkensis TaxID=1590651 RepID=A0ABR5AL85_9BACL|nr:RND transporter [Paenibacillus sp. VKM B-2647]